MCMPYAGMLINTKMSNDTSSIEIIEVMDMMYYIHKYRKYLLETLDYGEDHHEVITVDKFLEDVQSHIKKRTD